MTILAVLVSLDLNIKASQGMKPFFLQEGLKQDQVIWPTQDLFDSLRLVQNGACNHVKPSVIVRPKSAAQVASCLRAAKKFNLPVSVRSGGHSYECMSVKNNSLHIDMRLMNKIQRLDKEVCHFPLKTAGVICQFLKL